eukprot:m.248340 g.248340  ORF g.248340 m.248340 type:complete len:93 (-) comp54485_c0_seq7:1568-1846(-)
MTISRLPNDSDGDLQAIILHAPHLVTCSVLAYGASATHCELLRQEIYKCVGRLHDVLKHQKALPGGGRIEQSVSHMLTAILYGICLLLVSPK